MVEGRCLDGSGAGKRDLQPTCHSPLPRAARRKSKCKLNLAQSFHLNDFQISDKEVRHQRQAPQIMQSVRQIERLNQAELDKVVPPNASWHTDYRDTAYIYIGGLPFELSEGDILTIFSQYGNPVHINLVRDKETGKSKGFCFLKYEDQRSCDLAVDNLSGAGVMGRVLSVDHTRYKKKEGEIEGLGLEEEAADEGDETDREGDERRKRRRTESESEEERPLLKEEVELAKLLKEHEDDDPMKEYLVQQKRDEVAEALKALDKSKKRDKDRRHDSQRKHRHRHHRSRKDDEDDDRDRRRERHRSRRERDEEEGGDRKDRSHRTHRSERGENGRRGEDRHSRGDRSRTPASDEDRSRKKRMSHREDSRSSDDGPREKRDRERRRDRSEGSREPYRRR